MKLTRLLNESVRRWHKRQHYEYQRRIAEAIVEAMEAAARGETSEIPVQLPRQAGKTTVVVDTTEFLLVAFRRYFGRPLRVGIFAPQIEQATTDFDRLKLQFADLDPMGFKTKLDPKGELKIPEKWNSKTIRMYRSDGELAGEVYIFPISKTSNPESKTLDLIIIEEAQDIDDEKMKKSVFPMGASTNAPRIYIGTAGTRLCYFKRQLENNTRRIVVALEEVFRQRRDTAKSSGDQMHLLYERFVEHEIQVHGAESDYIQTQYYGKWIIGAGQFTTQEELDRMIVKGRTTIDENKEWVIPDDKKQRPQPAFSCYVGIDTAKSPDRTVVTVLRDNTVRKKTELLGWLSLPGENYEDQFEMMKKWLAPFQNIRAIAIDATGQGDFMPDKFERHTSYNLHRVKFSAETKDVIYKNLLQVTKNNLTELPDVPMNRDYQLFRQEMLDLQKEYKGRFMSCHHPDAPNAHDDYPDSWALAEYALTLAKTKEPSIRFL